MVTGSDSERKEPVREGGSRASRGVGEPNRQPGGVWGMGAEEDEKMGLLFGLLWLFTSFLQGVHSQGVYGKDGVHLQTNSITSITDCSTTPTLHLKYHQHQPA